MTYKEKIDRVRNQKKLPCFKKKRMASSLIINDLRNKGFFIDTGDSHYWFWSEQKKIFPVDSPYFVSLVEDWYGINASEPEFKYLVEALRTEIQLRGRKSEVYQFARYQDQKLYISKFDGQVFRLNGEEVEVIPNGQDGVFFYDDPKWEPYEYLGSEERFSYLGDLIIEPVNFSNGRLSPKEQKVIWQLWIYSIFFEAILPTKPILVFLGPKGSGKTSDLRWVLKVLFGSKVDVCSLARKREDAFISIITSTPLAVFDNVDVEIAWLNDHLATLSTGGNISLRKLYTTNEKVTYYPKIFVAITSRTPQFKRDDVVDRLLLLKVSKLENFIPERRLIEERLKVRNQLWTELLNDLNQIVKAFREDQETLITKHRLADWVEFGWKVSKLKGIEKDFLDIAGKLEIEKSTFLLEDDPLYIGLELWLNDPSNQGREVDIRTLFSDLMTVCMNNKIKWTYDNPRQLAQRISKVLANLEDFFEVKRKQIKQKGQHYVYSFKTKSRV